MTGADLPSYERLMLPVLRQIETGCETISLCLPGIQQEFGLSDAAMDLLLPSGKMTYMANRAHWARNYMKHAGLVEPLQRGRYRLTEAGRALLAEAPAALDKASLMRFEMFRDWIDPPSDNTDAGPIVAADAAPSITPEEQIDAAVFSLDADLANDLLDQVRLISPLRFERLIVELLLAMGYGGGLAEMGRAIGKSGDGGIDGVVNEDRLGLDAVYIQAKRHAADNTVGRPSLQAFVGSMTGESATKGVFVTTSGFSKEAVEFVRRIQQRVVLIDGRRLARLMIDHGVGVKTDRTYALRSIDENFFATDWT